MKKDKNSKETIELCKKLLEVEKDNYKLWIVLASELGKAGKTDEAIEAFKKAASINPDEYFIYKKLADIYYLIKNDPVLNIFYYEKFIKYEPDNTDAKACLGLSYLKLKNYKEGWGYFENRPHKKNAISKIEQLFCNQKPVWQGEDAKNKTIFVYPEAGFGDTIMFARFLPKLKNICKKVLFEPESETYKLFKESDLGVDILKSKEISNYDFDYHIPIMSLPCFLKINNEEDIPFKEGYLKANSQKVEQYKKKYFLNDTYKIGIFWHGHKTEDTTKPIKLKTFYKLFNLKNTKFYSLQKGYGIEQLQETKGYEIVDLGSTFKDFSDTAAAIENLDLVISIDTAVAHLAGAMGKPCWVLLPFVLDWRWGTDLNECYWYGSVKTFKQKEAGNWDEVMDMVDKELKQSIKQ